MLGFFFIKEAMLSKFSGLETNYFLPHNLNRYFLNNDLSLPFIDDRALNYFVPDTIPACEEHLNSTNFNISLWKYVIIIYLK